MNAELVRKRVIFSGMVQGVGFRASTVRHAQGLKFRKGFVRNLPDGTVELAIEGEQESFDTLMTRIKDERKDYIKETEISDLPANFVFEDT